MYIIIKLNTLIACVWNQTILEIKSHVMSQTAAYWRHHLLCCQIAKKKKAFNFRCLLNLIFDEVVFFLFFF